MLGQCCRPCCSLFIIQIPCWDLSSCRIMKEWNYMVLFKWIEWKDRSESRFRSSEIVFWWIPSARSLFLAHKHGVLLRLCSIPFGVCFLLLFSRALHFIVQEFFCLLFMFVRWLFYYVLSICSYVVSVCICHIMADVLWGFALSWKGRQACP